MKSYSTLKVRNTKFTPPKPITQYPKNSIQKLAVLFTDIVGSSNYFKSYGDIAGRKMLRLHQDMASGPINEHGGILVKLLGDSVMSYFFDAKEALKSAIKIQQAFFRHNQQHDAKDQIHIRIGIHFGEGIVEENDIFGDVVNTAAKFLDLVEGDQIFVSQQVYDQVAASLHSIQFLPVKVSTNTKALKGLSLYRIIWDKTVNLDPVLKTLILFKPVWGLAKKSFTNVWNSLSHDKGRLWMSDHVLLEKMLPDKSLALILKNVDSSVDIIKRVREYLTLNMGHDGSLFIPVQTVVDCGPFLRADRLSLEPLEINWDEIKPGEIYLSAAAYEKTRDTRSLSVVPASASTHSQSFYQLLLDDKGNGDSSSFLYQNALVQGDNAPCFYCSDRRHLATDCPSKQLMEISRDTNKLGYLPMEKINKLFLNYLSKTASNTGMTMNPGEYGKAGGDIDLAHKAFYDLKAVYQLRFFKTIWGVKEESWDKVKGLKSDEDKGGLLWIGLDCLRVSNLDQAESIFKDFLVANPKDYRVYCALGFLYVEKKDLLQAKFFFKKAFDYTKTAPQKILTLFLLSRVYDLLDDPIRSQQAIRRIIYLSPYCPEALYQDILLKFRKGEKAVALHQLVKLIRKARDYYITALIDPDLANFGNIVQEQLENLFKEAKKEAQGGIPEAKEAVERLQKLIGQESKEVLEAQSILMKIEELSSTDSYFGYIDIIHYNHTIINMSHRLVEGRRAKLSSILYDLRQRITKYFGRINILTYPSLAESIHFQLKNIQRKLDNHFEIADSAGPDRYKQAFQGLDEISADMNRIESKLRRLDSVDQVLVFLSRFLKRSLVFQSINLVISLIFFPIAIHYLNFIIPHLHISPQNIWNFQKIFIILGGVAGIFLASIITPKK
ncbi:MAG: adenylate/guanylate cyclase domain-containing protein [Deltaproteobacteria bacterium]|nr:adenylate/guanylate cyclase domain-containing protein [Deltaproteobacteria bacterium]